MTIGDIYMKPFLLAVSVLALTACHTNPSDTLADNNKPQPVVQAAPAPIPSSSFICWDGSAVFNAGQCPAEPARSLNYNFAQVSREGLVNNGPVAIGNGQTLELVDGKDAKSAYIIRNPDGTIARKFPNQEAFEKFATNPYKRVVEEPVSTFSSDVDTASYSVARRQLKEGRLPQKDSIRIEEILNYFDYDYAKPKSKQEPFKPSINIVDSPWNAQTKLIHIGVQGYEPPKSKRPPMNLVFLVDTSGSMNNPDKLPLLKQSLEVLIEKLEKEDRVSIVTYGPRMETILVPTAGNRKADIRAALAPLSAQGGTNGEAGLQQAYRVKMEMAWPITLTD